GGCGSGGAWCVAWWVRCGGEAVCACGFFGWGCLWLWFRGGSLCGWGLGLLLWCVCLWVLV
ncbi:hypothetical protein, partial [Pseudomonas syringae group genomosp. 7]|uniref:hypothetical protein n=1 Tax=Pseudomonas syringae group genomosp. 7 TaxID=251699 RepID=UPI00377044A6